MVNTIWKISKRYSYCLTEYKTAGSICLGGYQKLMSLDRYKNPLLVGIGAADICRNISAQKRDFNFCQNSHLIRLYFSASESFDSTYPTNVVVTSSGLCTYIPPGIFKSSCPIDITWFPFDDQNCEMKFGSWTYNGFKVNICHFVTITLNWD